MGGLGGWEGSGGEERRGEERRGEEKRGEERGEEGGEGVCVWWWEGREGCSEGGSG